MTQVSPFQALGSLLLAQVCQICLANGFKQWVSARDDLPLRRHLSLVGEILVEQEGLLLASRQSRPRSCKIPCSAQMKQLVMLVRGGTWLSGQHKETAFVVLIG